MKEIKYDLENELIKDENERKYNLKIKRLKDLASKMSPKFTLKNKDKDGISIVALIFGDSGKAYFFSPGNFNLNTGDIVKVNDSSNVERLAGVVIGNSKINEETVKKELKPVLEIIYKNPANLQKKIK